MAPLLRNVGVNITVNVENGPTSCVLVSFFVIKLWHWRFAKWRQRREVWVSISWPMLNMARHLGLSTATTVLVSGGKINDYLWILLLPNQSHTFYILS